MSTGGGSPCPAPTGAIRAARRARFAASNVTPWSTLDGYQLTSPVGAFPPNGHGLVDMIGNVWGWTADPRRDHGAPPSSCCTAQPDSVTSRQVIKDGSHLCAPNDRQRYRPAARMAQPIDTSTSHVGFRCVRRSRPDHMEGISDA